MRVRQLPHVEPLHVELPWIEPIDAARRLAHLPRLGLLDSAMIQPALGRYSYLVADPFGCFSVVGDGARWNGVREAGAPLCALRERLAQFRTARMPELPPFQGGAVGSVDYEFGWTLEGRSAPGRQETGDDIDLAFHDVVVAFDHCRRRCWVIASGHPAGDAAARHARAMARLRTFTALLERAAPRQLPLPAGGLDWRPATSRAAYSEAVERVKSDIRAGDIYQANISQAFSATLPDGADALAFYAALRRANPAPFAAFVAQGRRTLLSTSPELFLLTDGRRVETRPIKGTAKRASTPTADAEAARALAASRKDRAENVMIVDLLRNDLSRVCRPNSVEVPNLCAIESYAGLHHLVSTVTGELRPDCDAVDLLAASFPGGSVTGAPKLRAMEIIAEIERERRGAYCGAIGWLGFDGAAGLNVAIRTLALADGLATLRVGGGVTLLSDPDGEYEETLVKAARIFEAFAPACAMADAG